MCVLYRYFGGRDDEESANGTLRIGVQRYLLHGLLMVCLAWTAIGRAAERHAHFDIPSQNLADALDRFSEQSGMQVVYDPSAVQSRQAPAIEDSTTVAGVLDRLLANTGLAWVFVNERTIAIRAPMASEPARHTQDPVAAPAAAGSLTRLSVIQVNEDPRRVLPNEASDAAFGFSKKLIDTPRSVSVISQEQTDLLRLSAVEDLVRLVPGAYTTTRYGIQGAIDIRNVPGDTYFRGMKRLTLQGHGRSVLAAMDSIEVVRGPPSPVDGMGEIGGFTNLVPKSGRARIGGYLDRDQGFAQLVVGAWDRKEFAAGIGGPLRVFGKEGGYYNYALLEDSGGYTRNVPVRQKLLQAAVSLDDFVGPFRIESGVNFQESHTAGALLNRITQELVDRGRYIRGDPLAMLDTNGNGSIGYLEYSRASPVRGNLSASNQPLAQRWKWPTDERGRPLSLDEFPQVPGIPQSLYDHLVTACAAAAASCPDPTGALRAQGPGGPLPISGYVPIGFALDPRTVGYDTVDLRRAGAYERDITAQFAIGYFDLIYDDDPDFTLKNQMFIDSMDQYKVSNQPSGGDQDVLIVANKLTVERRWANAPSWMRLSALGSVILRHTHSAGRRYGGDFGTNRTDVMNGDGAMRPNGTFVHSYENADLYDDGMPWTSNYDTDYWEAGTGVLFDIDLHEKTNVLVGGRFDLSRARNVDAAGIFDPTAGTAANPGVFTPASASAEGWDHGTSWSLSVSHAVWPEVRPYVTAGRSSIVLDRNNNSLTNEVIGSGHIGTAQLLEAGIKASLLDGKLFMSTALYEQQRVDGAVDDPAALLDTDVTQTRTTGWEAELKWVPHERLFLSAYALAQRSVFNFRKGSNVMVDARALGFQDVLDDDGNVIYPAEAFLYGGRAFLVLPDGLEQYAGKQGNPAVQLGVNATYKSASGLGFTLGGNYFSGVHSGRLKLIDLPQAMVLDAGAFLERDGWWIKLDVSNLFNERYFRARTGDMFSDMQIQAMPTRRWQLTAHYTF